MPTVYSKLIEDPESIRKCSHCSYTRKVKTFPWRANLGFSRKCHGCRSRDRNTGNTKKEQMGTIRDSSTASASAERVEVGTKEVEGYREVNGGQESFQTVLGQEDQDASVDEDSGSEKSGSERFFAFYDGDDEEEESERVFFSPEILARARKAFEDILSVAGQQQGLHPKLGRRLKRIFDDIDQIARALERDKRRRTNPLHCD